jgi:hypothetical protein
MTEPFILTNFTAAIWIFYTIVSSIILSVIILAISLYYQKSEINLLKMNILEHHHLLKRIFKDMKLEPGECIFVNNESIILVNYPDGVDQKCNH